MTEVAKALEQVRSVFSSTPPTNLQSSFAAVQLLVYLSITPMGCCIVHPAV